MKIDTMKLLTSASRSLADSDSLAILTPESALIATNVHNEHDTEVEFRESIFPENVYSKDQIVAVQDHQYLMVIFGDISLEPDDLWQPPECSEIKWIGGKLQVSMVGWIRKKLWSLGEITPYNIEMSWLKYTALPRTYLLKAPGKTEGIIPNIFDDFWPTSKTQSVST